MRIIAGSRKGARIFAPKGLDVRPTGDRVREAVFNLIGPVDGADVLDLFAGSGALGLEALSRGAASATFVESDRGRRRDRSFAISTGSVSKAPHVYREDAARRLASDAAAGRRYDLVLVDPPYRMLMRFLPTLAAHLPPSSRPTASSSSSGRRRRSPSCRCRFGRAAATARRA